MTKAKKDYWIPKSVNKHKKGSLHRMMGVPKSEPIPFMLVNEACETPIGEKYKNPTQTGKKSGKVTPLLKKRACWGRTLKRISRKNKKKD